MEIAACPSSSRISNVESADWLPRSDTLKVCCVYRYSEILRAYLWTSGGSYGTHYSYMPHSTPMQTLRYAVSQFPIPHLRFPFLQVLEHKLETLRSVLCSLAASL